MSDKRYFWLKLKEDFFEDEAIEWLEEQKNGKEYALFYLKLCLKSLKSNGVLMRKVGNMLVPYDANKLAEMTRTSLDTVVVALELLQNIGLVEILDTGAIYMTQLSVMTGSETAKAAYMRERRKQQAIEAKSNNEVTMLPDCSNKAVTGVTAEYRDKSIEYRDKNIKRNNIKRNDGEQAEPVSSNSLEKKVKPVKHKYGEYKNVLLTDEELEHLKELFPDDLQNRIERLSEYIASTGKSYKSHYATIKAWARRDKDKIPGRVTTKQAVSNVGPNGIAIDPSKTDLDDIFE